MNPFLATWLFADVATLIIGTLARGDLRRLGGTRVAPFVGLQFGVLLAAIGASLAPAPASSLLFWLVCALMNVSFAIRAVDDSYVGFRAPGALAVAGLVGTASALALVFLGAFSSIVVMAASTILCAGALIAQAVINRRGKRATFGS